MFAFVNRWAYWFAGMVQKWITAAGGPADFGHDQERFALKRSNDVAFLTNVYLAWG